MISRRLLMWGFLILLIISSSTALAQNEANTQIEPEFVLEYEGTMQYIGWSNEDHFIVAYAEQGSCCDRNNWYTITVWNANTGALLVAIDVGGVRFTMGIPVLSPDGDQVLAVVDNRMIRVWSVTTGQALFVLDREALSEDPVDSPHNWSARWSDDGRTIVSSTAYVYHQPLSVDTLQIWDADSGALLNESSRRGFLAAPVATWDSSGNRVALWDAGEFMVLDFPADRVLFSTIPEEDFGRNQDWMGQGYYQSMSWSEQGSRLLTCTSGQAQVWGFGD
jgi:hypothetical protein